MENKKIIILGSGGFGSHLKCILDQFNYKMIFKGFLSKEKKNKHYYYDDKNIGKKFNFNNIYFINGIGNFAFPWYPKLFINYEKKKMRFLKLQHKTSIISPTSKINTGTIILENSIVKSGAVIGKFCSINSGAIVSHNTIISDFCSISLGAKIAGGCKVGKNSFLGVNSAVIQDIKIGDNVIVGAGAIVTKNVPNNVVVAGNPARIIRKK